MKREQDRRRTGGESSPRKEREHGRNPAGDRAKTAATAVSWTPRPDWLEQLSAPPWVRTGRLELRATEEGDGNRDGKRPHTLITDRKPVDELGVRVGTMLVFDADAEAARREIGTGRNGKLEYARVRRATPVQEGRTGDGREAVVLWLEWDATPVGEGAIGPPAERTERD